MKSKYEISMSPSGSTISTMAPSTSNVSLSSSTIHASSLTVHPSSLTALVIDENHITRRDHQVHCITSPQELKVLCEHYVDFENFALNGYDLSKKLNA